MGPMDFGQIAALNQEPSATHLEPFIAAHLERYGPTKRIDLANAIEAAWLDNSGRSFQSDVMPKLKKALNHMATRGSVVQTGVLGVWQLVDSDSTGPFISDDGSDELSLRVAGDDSPRVEVSTPKIELELGDGDQLVYCFYLPMYRNQAQRDGEKRWPIKIGRTTGSLTTRLASLSTSMPELPVVAVVIRVHDADLLERAIQNILSFRGRWLSEAAGAEWYLTNPEEIAQIFTFIREDGEG
jgi:hypothetical protein